MPTIPMAHVNIYVALCGSRVHKQSRILYMFAAKVWLTPGMAWAMGTSRRRKSTTHYTALSCGPVQIGCCNTVKPTFNPDSSGSQVLDFTSVLDLIIL